MREPELSQMLGAAAALLLRPPDAAVLRALAEVTGVELDGDQARQDFYDVLCVPQSGRYIPPYVHVLACGTVRNGDWWHFPPARFDGGDSLAGWYAAIGFDPMALEADPMLRGPHRPLDQVGFVLAYLAVLSAKGETDTRSGDGSDSLVSTFMAENLNVWPDRFCNLLGGTQSPYLQAVAEAVAEAVQTVRARYPVVVSDATSAQLYERGPLSHGESALDQGMISIGAVCHGRTESDA